MKQTEGEKESQKVQKLHITDKSTEEENQFQET